MDLAVVKKVFQIGDLVTGDDITKERLVMLVIEKSI